MATKLGEHMVRLEGGKILLKPGRYTYAEPLSALDGDVQTTPFIAWMKTVPIKLIEQRGDLFGEKGGVFESGERVDAYLFEVPDIKGVRVIWTPRLRVEERLRVGFFKDLVLRGRPSWVAPGTVLEEKWGPPVETPEWKEILPDLPVVNPMKNPLSTLAIVAAAGAGLYYFFRPRRQVVVLRQKSRE